jgi:ankyrin repeat protein
MKNFDAFKPRNKSIFYDICIKTVDKNKDKLINQEECLKEIKLLKTIYLNKNKRNKQRPEKRHHFTRTILLSHKSIDDILKETKPKFEKIKNDFKTEDPIKKINKINFPKINTNIKKETKNMNPKIKKFFYGKQTRYTIYKHIKEYLESNSITISELIDNNPFQSKPYSIPGSQEFLRAVKFNKYEYVKNILKYNNKLLFAIDYFGQTAYHWAAKFSDIKMMKILISFGKHHNQKDFKGRTPIYLAAFYNNKDMCKFLLENNANLFLKDKENKSPADVTSNEELKHFLLDHMSHPFNNPVYKLKIKKILEEREINLSKNKKLSRSNSKFVGVAEQLFDINKYYI